MSKSDIRTLVIGTVTTVLALSLNGWAQTLHFISGEPTWLTKGGQGWPCYILKLEGDMLVPVWSSKPDQKVHFINNYCQDSVVMISFGFPSMQNVHVFQPGRLANPQVFAPATDQAGFFRHHIVKDPAGTGLLRALFFGDIKTSKTPYYKLFELRSYNEVSSKSLSDAYRIRISGAGSPYTGAPSNGVLAVQLDGSLFQPKQGDLGLGFAPISPGQVQTEPVKGWTLMATELDFAAIMPLPTETQAQRELLVFSFLDSSWTSFVLPGGETIMRPVNRFLVGIIAGLPSETDPEKSVGSLSGLSEEVVILDARAKKQFVVHLGKECEVLWLESNVVYYRLGEDLYRATIENDDFVDRQLLLTDPRVKHIHWAFSGWE